MDSPIPPSPPVGDDGSSLVAQLVAQSAEKDEMIQLLERRYNQEHQRGLSLELAGQKAENLASRLAEENAALKARVAQLEEQHAAKPVYTIENKEPECNVDRNPNPNPKPARRRG